MFCNEEDGTRRAGHIKDRSNPQQREQPIDSKEENSDQKRGNPTSNQERD